MTKRYEKFEEWMLHVPAVTSSGSLGEEIKFEEN